jgi:hypothetical protein
MSKILGRGQCDKGPIIDKFNLKKSEKKEKKTGKEGTIKNLAPLLDPPVVEYLRYVKPNLFCTPRLHLYS